MEPHARDAILYFREIIGKTPDSTGIIPRLDLLDEFFAVAHLFFQCGVSAWADSDCRSGASNFSTRLPPPRRSMRGLYLEVRAKDGVRRLFIILWIPRRSDTDIRRIESQSS
jgi:hypothetical protein